MCIRDRFRAADLGQKVVIVERYPVLGGVCLNVGCIPSKALLHAAKVITEAEEMNEAGVSFSKPEIDPGKLNQWKQGVVDKLTGGLAALARARKIDVYKRQVHGLILGCPVIRRPVLTTVKQSISFSGSIASITLRPSIWSGRGNWTRMP